VEGGCAIAAAPTSSTGGATPPGVICPTAVVTRPA
jgi:hypothetical protein